MAKVTKEDLKRAYKPLDIVTNKKGCVGFISEVSVNECQDTFKHKIQYSVTWLVGSDKSAWFYHEDLEFHCNLYHKIAEGMCHPFGHNDKWVSQIIKN